MILQIILHHVAKHFFYVKFNVGEISANWNGTGSTAQAKGRQSVGAYIMIPWERETFQPFVPQNLYKMHHL